MIDEDLDKILTVGYCVPGKNFIVINSITYIIVPVVIKETIVDNITEYKWIELRMPTEKYTYSGLIDELVNFKYDLSKNIAIINNYLLEPTNIEYKKEFDDLQEWRLTAKNIAKKHFNML
jgi:hypothetical protein